jgi:hypothetical protein
VRVKATFVLLALLKPVCGFGGQQVPESCVLLLIDLESLNTKQCHDLLCVAGGSVRSGGEESCV